MNSVLSKPCNCAIDGFMEVSTHLFLPYLSNIRVRSELTELLFNAC